MTRGSDPGLTYQAEQFAVYRRLVDGDRLDELEAARWLARWEHKAEEIGRPRGSAGYWDEGWRWIARRTCRAGPTMTRVGIMLAVAFVLSGCSALTLVPNQDHGSSGCQNARGIGPPSGEEEPPIGAALIGKAPAEAAATAASQGHTVVFNVQIEGYGECWCVPPPKGKVVEVGWGQHGALWLMVDGVDEGHTSDAQPARGWGC